MNRKIRSKFEVFFSILFVIHKGSHRRTHIMYAANINQKVLMPKLTLLLKNGLIEEQIIQKKQRTGWPRSKEPPSHSEYYVTAFGEDMLKAYHGFQERVGDSILCPLEDRRVLMSLREASKLSLVRT